LTIPERIKLFKEVNRVHREIYGWRVLYQTPWGKVYFIDIDKNTRATYNNWVPMCKSEIIEYYFRDRRGRDITSLRGLFAWQAESFYHVNPYVFRDYDHKLKEEDFVTDNLGKRIKLDISQPVKCLETSISVQQRR
jgi:hypothetical protein